MVDFTKPVQTRGGRKVRILCTDRPSNAGYSVVAMYDDGNINCWNSKGEALGGFTSINNLIQEPKIYKVWVVVVLIGEDHIRYESYNHIGLYENNIRYHIQMNHKILETFEKEFTEPQD